MALKNKVQVAIDGKVFPLMGTESPEYITSVAEYIDKRISTIRESDRYNSLTSYLAVILACINITDELFKEREKLEEMESFDSKTSKGSLPALRKELKEVRLENERLKEELNSIESTYIEEIKEKQEAFEKEKKELEEKINSLHSAIIGSSSGTIDLSEIKGNLNVLIDKINNIEDSFRDVLVEEKRRTVCVDKRRRAEIYSAK